MEAVRQGTTIQILSLHQCGLTLAQQVEIRQMLHAVGLHEATSCNRGTTKQEQQQHDKGNYSHAAADTTHEEDTPREATNNWSMYIDAQPSFTFVASGKSILWKGSTKRLCL